MVSKNLREAVKLSDMRAYQIAHRAGMHYTQLSRILNGIDEVRFGDPRVLRVGKVLGLNKEECFEE